MGLSCPPNVKEPHFTIIASSFMIAMLLIIFLNTCIYLLCVTFSERKPFKCRKLSIVLPAELSKSAKILLNNRKKGGKERREERKGRGEGRKGSIIILIALNL